MIIPYRYRHKYLHSNNHIPGEPQLTDFPSVLLLQLFRKSAFGDK